MAGQGKIRSDNFRQSNVYQRNTTQTQTHKNIGKSVTTTTQTQTHENIGKSVTTTTPKKKRQKTYVDECNDKRSGEKIKGKTRQAQ